MPTKDEHRARCVDAAKHLKPIIEGGELFQDLGRTAYLLTAANNEATPAELEIVTKWVHQLQEMTSILHMMLIGGVESFIQDKQLLVRPIGNDPVAMVQIMQEHGVPISAELQAHAAKVSEEMANKNG